MKSDIDRFSSDLYPIAEVFRPTVNYAERFIRAVLMMGFITVLAIEAWLLVQALQLWL
jgi:hypothetical protein